MYKRIFTLVFLVLCLFSCVNCSSVKVNSAANARDAKEKTVALIYKDIFGEYNIYCAGVWISETEIMTAAHCVNSQYEDQNAVGLTLDVVSEDMIKKDNIVPVKAVIAKVDTSVDLALLKVDKWEFPKKRVAPIGETLPSVGEEVHIVGHVAGLPWTYSHGVVSAKRGLMSRAPIQAGTVQIETFAYRGNSGGGAFNSQGELIGICSFFFNAAPGQIFFISVDDIRKFLSS